jgi:hypothetical protein
VSWLPDVVPNIYRVAAVYDKLPKGHHGGLPPENRAYGKTLHYIPDVMVPEAARLG